jgi:hypothetical protein
VHQKLNGVNRRGAIRRKPKGVEVSCRRGALGVGPDIAVMLRSLSETGARLLVTTRLKAGEEVEVEFRGASTPKVIRLLADVVRTQRVPGEVYCTAVRFQKRLSYGEFTRMT